MDRRTAKQLLPKDGRMEANIYPYAASSLETVARILTRGHGRRFITACTDRRPVRSPGGD